MRTLAASLALVALLAVVPSTPVLSLSADQPRQSAAEIPVGDLDREVRSFLDREMAAHLADIRSLNPPPERVLGALTTGEYTWGTFMRSLAAYAQLSGAATLAGRDLPRTIGEIGLVEVRLGGTRFSQLYAALSLRHYGTDLSKNRCGNR